MPANYSWKTRFVTELQHSLVTGAAIGDAVAEVESHLRESGQSAQEAFGDPVAYARSLNLPKRRHAWLSALDNQYLFFFLAGAYLLPAATQAIKNHAAASTVALPLAAMSVLMPALALVDLALGYFLREKYSRAQVAKISLLVGVLAFATAWFLVRKQWSADVLLPTIPTLIYAVACLGIGTWLGWTQNRRKMITFPDRPAVWLTPRLLDRAVVIVFWLVILVTGGLSLFGI